MAGSGTLFVVATPIGNLEDLGARAAEVLRRVEIVAAEDTRRTGRLLAHVGVKKRLVSCHKFNERRRLCGILDELRAGRDVALVTDGGTPGLSDPGHRLVAAAHDEGLAVVAIPGPSALAAALSVAGLEADRFHFAGFPPARRPQRRRELERLAALPETIVLFEAPHRLVACLQDALDLLGDRPATLCRELTKLHEEVRRASLAELLRELSSRAEVLGEIVLVIGGRPKGASPVASDSQAGIVAAWRGALAREDGDARRALRLLARELGVPRAQARRLVDQALPQRDLR